MLNNTRWNRQQIMLPGILLVTTALPLSHFNQSLWRDEASSVWFARLRPGTLRTALCDARPPGYYLLLKAWLAGGENEFWLRLPSLFAAVLAVALTYRLGREMVQAFARVVESCHHLIRATILRGGIVRTDDSIRLPAGGN